MEDQENQFVEPITVKQVSMRYGLILGLIQIVYFIILNFAGLAANKGLGWVGYLFFIVAVVLAHKAFKEGGDSFMSYGQGLGIGTFIALISGTISSIFTYIYIKFIDDSLIAQISEQQITSMEERGMSDSEIETALEFSSKFTTPGMIAIFGIVFFVLIGFIICLIVSAITKKNNPSLEI